MTKDKSLAMRLAAKSLEAGDGTGWFEALYREAGADVGKVPWADLAPNPSLLPWIDELGLGPASKVLVVGCGLGDDAEAFAARGAQVTAFDISPSAIAWAKKRFPESAVDYVVADLTALPPAWHGKFDWVFEAYTLQAIPADLRRRAIPALAPLVGPGGRIFIVCRGADDEDADAGPPWALTMEMFAPLTGSLLLERYYDGPDQEEPPVRRFRSWYLRPSFERAPVLADEVREDVIALERLAMRRRVVGQVMLSMDGYERWGRATPEDIEREMAKAGVEPGESGRLASEQVQLVERLRGSRPEVLRAWAEAHAHLREVFLASLPPEADSTARFVAAQERAALLAFADRGGELPEANTYYVHLDPAAHAAVFGEIA